MQSRVPSRGWLGWAFAAAFAILWLHASRGTRPAAAHRPSTLLAPGSLTSTPNARRQHPRRIFVVGCGHSGTSLLFRSIGNMRGVRCLQKETALFVKNTEGDARLKSVMAEWDALALQGNYSSWVEKTPRHVYFIEKMLELDSNPGNTKIVFIHRDGRDVATSFRARGYSWEKAVTRWVEDNEAALSFVDSGKALAVGFEKLTDSRHVLSTLRRVAEYLGIGAVTDRELALSLLPGTRQHDYQEYCTAYTNDDEKFSDLASSLVEVLAGQARQISGENGGSVNSTVENGGGSKASGVNSKLELHNMFRTWQMSQAWTEIAPSTRWTWTAEEETWFWGRGEVKRLMRRFGYVEGT